MSYTTYTNQEFEKLAKDGQINIMALFGNGVDIQLMEYLESPYRTSYINFYNYLCYKNFDKDNLIFKKMSYDKQENDLNPDQKSNWSDFENSLIEIFNQSNYFDGKKLNSDFKEFQIEFSNFLNEIISPEMLAKIGTDSTEEKIALKSFEEFLKDLDETNYTKLSFPLMLSHYKLFNWEILNFNYTSMLDNILILDKEQYDPHPWPHADRQINFKPNPNGYGDQEYETNENTNCSSYLMTNITHPHGYQNVPKSMLFGFDNENQIENEDHRNKAKNFLKPYWAQNDKKYKSYFNDTHLFIIYGLSLGQTDFWWWNNILNSLLTTDAELIIYNFNFKIENKNDDDVINNFIAVASDTTISKEDRKTLHNKIAVVQYDSNTELHAFKLSKSIE